VPPNRSLGQSLRDARVSWFIETDQERHSPKHSSTPSLELACPLEACRAGYGTAFLRVPARRAEAFAAVGGADLDPATLELAAALRFFAGFARLPDFAAALFLPPFLGARPTELPKSEQGGRKPSSDQPELTSRQAVESRSVQRTPLSREPMPSRNHGMLYMESGPQSPAQVKDMGGRKTTRRRAGGRHAASTAMPAPTLASPTAFLSSATTR
jgi:hypothetical protein